MEEYKDVIVNFSTLTLSFKTETEENVEERYYCSEKFQQMLRDAVGDDLNFLHGYRLIDYRGG